MSGPSQTISSVLRDADYYRLRESIRHRGLVEPLVVGKKSPRNSRHLVCGGNSRLEILESLHRETNDPKYLIIDCVERNPPSELKINLSHLIQNDGRRTKTFIERASALVHCVELIEVELGSEKLTQARAVEVLRKEGYPISASLYNQMIYAVDVLIPVLPRALGSGMGRPQVERIRSLFKIGNTIWKEFGEFGTSFEQVFAEVCAATDSPNWSIDELRYQLEYEIYSSCDLELQLVRLMFDVEAPELDSIIGDLRKRDTKSATTGRPKRRKRKRNPSTPSRPTNSRNNGVAASIAVEANSEVATQSEFNRRQRYARKLAMQLAELSGATRQIEPSKYSPIGFSVIPKSAPVDQRQELILSYLGACQGLIESYTPLDIKVPLALTEVTDAQWSYLRDLMNVTRALKRSLKRTPIAVTDETSKPVASAA